MINTIFFMGLCLVISFLIHQHEAEGVAGFRFIPQCLNMEAVVPGCLKYVNAARFHGRPCHITIFAVFSHILAALFAQVTGACQENEGLIVAILEYLPFQVNQPMPDFL